MANATTGQPLLLKQTRNFIAGRLFWLGGRVHQTGEGSACLGL